MSRLVFTVFLTLFFGYGHSQVSALLNERANEFLATLSDGQLEEVMHSFEDSARLKWNNLPVGMEPRTGLRFGDMSSESKIALHHVLGTILSSQGYLKVISIMQLDDILNQLVETAYSDGKFDKETYDRIRDLDWAYDNFYVACFGDPGDEAPWGMSFGGHHLALNATVNGELISLTPLFMGTDPAEVRSGKYSGWRVLSKEEDYGFMLLQSLDENQLTSAVLDQEVPRDIITNPRGPQRIDSTYGISGKDMTDVQRELLKLVISEYVHNVEHTYAHNLYDRILKSGVENVHFAWIGSLTTGEPHYYIINSPDILIEYDNYPNNGNHIHVVMRTKDGDFGADLLREHYLNSEHHKERKD